MQIVMEWDTQNKLIVSVHATNIFLINSINSI